MLTPEQQNEKTRLEAAAFAAKMAASKTTSVKKNPFSPSLAKIEAAKKAEPVLTLKVKFPSEEFNGNISEISVLIQQAINTLVFQAKEYNLSGKERKIASLCIEIEANVS